jgi:hypothetical protein
MGTLFGQSSKPQPSLENDQDTTQLDEISKEHKLDIDKLQRQWNLERNSLRQEVQRLNLENSWYRNGREAEISLEKYEEDEEEEELMRYELPRRESSGRLDFILGVSAMEEIKCSSSVDVNDNAETIEQSPSKTTAAADLTQETSTNPDITALQSIISTLRTALQSTTAEKEALSLRLDEEQSRSAAELKAFAKTLEGVDDLRKSAERMGREIRRIKVKGYRPTGSVLISDGNNGRLTASFAAPSLSYPNCQKRRKRRARWKRRYDP